MDQPVISTPDAGALLTLVQSIPNQLQMAREYAILGNYDVALNYFDVALGSIGKFIRSITSADDRRQWFNLKEQVQSEVKLVKSLQATLLVFRMPPGSGAPTPIGGSTSGTEDNVDGRWPAPGPLPPSTYGARSGVAAAAGIGSSKRGAPFAPGAGPPAWAGAAPAPAVAAPSRPSLSRANPTTGSGAPPPRSRVAAAPAPAAGRGAGSSITAGGKPPVPKQPAAAGVSGRGNVKAGPGGCPAPQGGKPKYSELHHLAADTELIAMVENDMLDLSPNVSFDSIAGLEEAKGLINEAVVLPMLIPDYFQVRADNRSQFLCAHVWPYYAFLMHLVFCVALLRRASEDRGKVCGLSLELLRSHGTPPWSVCNLRLHRTPLLAKRRGFIVWPTR